MALGACLIWRPEVFLLDEPESRLDTSCRERLEALIQSFDGAVMLVSRDRYFLDRIADEVVEVSESGLRRYVGGYSACGGSARSESPLARS